MKIKIGDAVSLSGPSTITVTLDDRQQIIETVGGNVVQDFGLIESGTKITLSVKFYREEFAKVWNYFVNRLLVDFTDNSGTVWNNTRVRVTSYGYEERFEHVINAELELWRI